MVRHTAVWLSSAWVFFGLLLPCRAQINNQDRPEHTPRGYWQKTYEPQSKYSINVQAIQHQISVLLKPLSHLSVVDPPTYALLQDDLHAYLRQLDQEKVDYGKEEIYHMVQLRLIRFDDQIKEALVESRRIAHEEGFVPAKMQDLPKGHKVALRPYALLFAKPDYQSTLLHVILPRETVTILKDEGHYCQVQCALFKGYLSKGMILDSHP